MGNGSDHGNYDWLYTPEPTRDANRPSTRATDPGLPPPQLPSKGSTEPRRQRRGRGFTRLLGLVFVVWLVFMIGVPLLAWQELVRVDANPGADRPAPGKTTTFIVAGTDERPGERNRGRTDTLMLLTFGSGPTVLTSIPRDSLVDIPGRGRTKVNAAYAYGGAPLLVRTLEQATGLRIDGFTQVGFDSLVQVVDAVGGIEVCPEKDLKDRDSKLDIKAGCQIVDGVTALAYSRNRKSFASGDIARGQSQREVIGGIGKAVLQPATFLNPIRWARVNNSAATALAVSENVNMLEFGRFAWALSNAMSGDGLNCTVPIRDMRVTWDGDRASEYFSHLKNGTADRLGGLCTEDGMRK